MTRHFAICMALIFCTAAVARANDWVLCGSCKGTAACDEAGVIGGGCGGCDAPGCQGLGCQGLGCQETGCDGLACAGCDGCSSCDGCLGGCRSCQPKLFGLFLPSDHRFASFISPMTNPIFFEDPRTLTEARLIFFNHKIPSAVGGGTVQLLAMQLRAALTERLSIVAAKDGYATSSHPLIDDGWADVAVGLKYNLWADPFAQRLLSVGASYELPVGSSRLFQGNGEGEFHLYLTGGTQVGARSHWLSAVGYRLPVDSTDESQSLYWSNHFDYMVTRRIYLFTESNWYHWTQSGQDGLVGIEGLDVINFGSQDVANNDIVTLAFGTKYKPHDHLELGVAWEFPVTNRQDIIDNRLTVDCILRY